MTAQAISGLLKQTYADFNEDKAPRLGAALAYYTTFSVAPLLIVVISIAGLVFGQKAAQGQIFDQIQGIVGPAAAEQIQNMLAGAQHRGSSIFATIIGLATLLAGAAGVFGQLQDALNTIWGVAPKPGGGIMATIKGRFLSFGMVLGTGFLLLVSLVLTAAISAVNQLINGVLPLPELVLHLINMVVSLGIMTVMFAMIFRVLPDVEIDWKDVWIGAAITAFLFTIGKFALGLYLGHSSFTSTYGAAGSLVVILLWVYYAAQILFFGAEFTKCYANAYGSHIKPSPNAVAVTAEARAEQGLAGAPMPAAAGTAVVVPFAACGLTPPTKGESAATEEGRKNLEDLAAVAAGAGLVALFSWWRVRRGN